LLVRSYAGNFDALGFPYTDDLVLHRAKGCDKCNNGYRGRTAIVELLEGSDEVKALIQSKAVMERIREEAVKGGMTTLMQDGIRKVFLGLTDIQQVRKVCIK
jgi:type II secretory ATPase GspE/PulE/Tfp pilus assembly ATPase PilB-like protein